MRKILLIAFVISLLFSCNTTKKSVATDINTQPDSTSFFEIQKKGVDFYAVGKEPFWSLEIDFDKRVSFNCPDTNEKIEIPIIKLGQERELPVITYELKEEGTDLVIHIQKNDKTFNLSENDKPYKVKVDIKKGGKKEFPEYNGQGEYYGNILLHDVWMLNELNGKSINEFKFRENPFIQIHLNNYRVSGHLGCNNFSGSIFFGREQIFFQHLLSTKMACLDADIEDLFAKTISNKMFYYKIDNNTLMLENGTDNLVFKKR